MPRLSTYRVADVDTYYGAAGRNFDYPEPHQGRMVRQQLTQVAAAANALNAVLRDTDRLPAWVQYKIATGEDRIRVAAEYMVDRIKAEPQGVSYGAAEPAAVSSYLTFGMGLLIGGVLGAAFVNLANE